MHTAQEPDSKAIKQPVDAVITWVDGNDPVLKIKRRLALDTCKRISTTTVDAGMAPTRFQDNGELEYCIRSIRRNANWIRKIFIVTDDQAPAFLTPETQASYGIELINHTDIFISYEWALPTFNTRTIESALWRIPGISSRFLYFNDDFFLNRPVLPSDFFRGENVVCRGRWKRIRTPGRLRLRLETFLNRALKRILGISRTMHLLQQMKSARMAGMKSYYYRIPHVPHPVRTETLRKFFERNPDAFERNIQFQFRDTNQFSAIFLSYYLEILNKSAELEGENDQVMLSGERDSELMTRRKLIRISEGKDSFVCLQSIEKLSPSLKSTVFETLERRLAS